MIKMKLTLGEDRVETVQILTKDIAIWEMGGPGRSMKNLSEGGRIVDLYGVALVAAKRLGLVSHTTSDKEFIGTVELDITAQEVSQEADPSPTGV